MYIEICGPDDTDDDNEDAENVAADATKMRQLLTVAWRVDRRESGAHLSGPRVEI